MEEENSLLFCLKSSFQKKKKMESWSYASGGKNFVSDESVSATTDGIARSKSGFLGWELKSPSSFENCTFMCSSQENLKNQEFVELGTCNILRKPLPSDSITDVLSCQYGCERVYNPVAAPPNAVPGEEVSSSKLSCSIVDSNCRDSSLIDLKLGRISDHRDAQTKANPNFSSAVSPIPPTKRARAGSLCSQTPFCQVHGCKKDLSSSKDYHKRHKVCEIHSKTSKVIVNGIEQRFCQQCSRFHLLAEFDDGKRSCRKRLAGHNERRRRPHIGMHSGRAGRLFQSYNGSRLQETSFALSSFVCQDILPNGILHPQKYEMSDWYRSVKVEDEGDYSPHHLGIPNNKGQMHTKSHLTCFNSQKQCAPVPEDGLIAVTRTIKMNENSNSFLHSMSTTSDFDARSLFHSSSLGSGELTVLDSSSTVQGLPAVSNSGCALSLLSSQSQNSSNQSSGIPTALPLITTSSHSHSHSHYGVTQVSEKLMRVSPQTSASAVSNVFHSSGLISAEDSQMEPILISSDGLESVNYGINGIIHHGSPYMNPKNNVSCGEGSTIDLLQLSSQLQRVEHQRQSMQVKQEADAFFGLRIT